MNNNSELYQTQIIEDGVAAQDVASQPELPRVAITAGDTNGVGYEVILKTLVEPLMLELCIPILYGNPKTMAYHRKALGIEINYTVIQQAAEARPGRINLLGTRR